MSTNPEPAIDFGLDFSAADRALFLREISTAARDFKAELGAGTAGGEQRSTLLQESLARLVEESVEFSPVLEVIPLDEEHFANRGSQMSPELKDLAQKFDFYLLNVPITLVPAPGWGFTQLECSIELNPGKAPNQRPVAHEIFPREEWQDMIGGSLGLSIGLDENLEFKAEPSALIPEAPGLTASATAKAQLRTSNRVVVGPFNYNIRRPKIISRGRHHVRVYWRMEGAEQFEREEPRLGIVMKTPKGIAQVDVEGIVKVAKNFHTFTADLRLLLRYVRERTRHFFEQGAPLGAEMKWADVTATVRGK